jgi:hypothetical protein
LPTWCTFFSLSGSSLIFCSLSHSGLPLFKSFLLLSREEEEEEGRMVEKATSETESKRARERDTQRKREKEKKTERERERSEKRESERERVRERERERVRERQSKGRRGASARLKNAVRLVTDWMGMRRRQNREGMETQG